MDNARGVNRKNCTTIGDFVPSLPGLRKVNPPLARPQMIYDLIDVIHNLFIYGHSFRPIAKYLLSSPAKYVAVDK